MDMLDRELGGQDPYLGGSGGIGWDDLDAVSGASRSSGSYVVELSVGAGCEHLAGRSDIAGRQPLCLGGSRWCRP
ncbi:hypothetical protein AOB60_01200 [Streptomyces noursei]|uniref:Uncharacterized protein n=1 Tax=Streptomyces noursei TaxID=1971 RepID=A0A2N8PRC8_STRNR|nr:hypothetical protein AOB60_01200 [Streptomyces noursei]